ncbi:MAG: CvpA family protein [Verrucomicrobia bacterium]|nr:CvpA family protein [Verrucomicrobiota bacterium]
MWIYLLIGLIFLILALECYFKGGINALVTLMGVIVAVNLSGWFGSMAFQWMGDKWWPIDAHPFWNRAVPVVAGFITLVVLFSILGTVASIMVRKRLEAQWEEYRLENYKGMNRKFGLSVGLITASVYSVMALTLIYQLGNFTVPFKHDDDPWALKTLSEAREQLDDTPFVKLAAAYDNTPELHYEVRDTLVLLLNNRATTLEEHMRAYPGFYALAETSEIKSLLGLGESEEEEEEDPYLDQETSDGGDSSDESLYVMWKKQAGNLSFPKLLGNSEVVSAVNRRYEELRAIEPNSEEEKKLLAFMKDIRAFFDTGESELYGRDAIVGRWQFAPNVSLRENKKTRTTISVDEMRGIQSTVGKMRRVTLQVWPEADRNQIRVNGLSVAGAYDQVLKKLREAYQGAIDNGDVDDDSFGYGPGNGGGFSQPVGFEETYGTDGGEDGSQAKDQEVIRMLSWIMNKDPGWLNRQLSQSMRKGESMRIGSGKWEGSGIRYQVNVKPDKVDLSKEAEFLSGAMRTGWPLRSGKLKSTIVKGRLHIQSGRDVFVFTRY